MQATVSNQTYRKRKQWNLILRHVIINFFMLVILLPLAWVFLLSIKSIPDAYTGKLWPDQFDFTHYQYVIEKIDTLLTNLFNSIYVTGATVAITCVAAVLAGYLVAMAGAFRLLAGAHGFSRPGRSWHPAPEQP